MSEAKRKRPGRFRSVDGAVVVDGLIELEFVGSNKKYRPVCRCGWYGKAVTGVSYAEISYQRHLDAIGPH